MDRDEAQAADRWQHETSAWVRRVLAAARASADYSGARLRHERRDLVVYAVAAPSESMAELIREVAPTLRVTWVRAPYTSAELNAEVHRLMATRPPRIVSASPRSDGTGIHVTTTDTALLRTDVPQRELDARYPISVEYGEPPTAA